MIVSAGSLALIGIALLVGGLIGALLMQLRMQQRLARLREENTALSTQLELEQKKAEEKIAELEKNRAQLSETFTALSSEALHRNNEQFLKLAQEKLRQFNIEAQHELSKKEQAIEHILKPIRETLDKTEKQLREIEQDRKQAYGSITKHLETMAATQQLLHGETRNLSQALRRPEVRGQWGELTLKRLVELAGMVQHCDFYEQEHTATDSGSIRPDMIIRMPSEREIVVDVKTPLDAYLSAIESSDDRERNTFLERHAQKVRERIRELASKSYWNQFSRSPDFVVLFIPGDQFLNAALDKSPDLIEYALRQKVILATPTSLVALLRAVAYGWSQQSVAENAEKIRQLGEDLYRRIGAFTSHLSRVGKSLGNSIEHYNNAVGSFQRQVLSGARKFSDMGLTTGKEPETLEPVEKAVRSLNHDEPA